MENKFTNLKEVDDVLSSWINNKRPRLIITSTPSLAEIASIELKKTEKKIILFPHTETLPYDFFSPSKYIKSSRSIALTKLISRDCNILITSIQSLISPCPNKLHLLPFDSLKINEIFDRTKFIDDLINAGYERKELVTDVGEYALRGSIIDVYPISHPNPIRIEIIDNKIESLRTFNSTSQITIEKIKSFNAVAAHEYPLDQIGITNFKKNWREEFDTFEEDSPFFNSITNKKAIEGAEIYLPLFFNCKNTLIDYLNDFQDILLDINVKQKLKDYDFLINERYENYKYDIQRPLLKPDELFLTKNEFSKFLQSRYVTEVKFDNHVDKKISKEKIKPPSRKNYTLNLQLPKINDHVVHLHHGVGIFKGLKSISSNSIISECLEIEFQKESKVYVPIHNMDLVSKYFGPEEVLIDKLGSKKWEKKKTLAIKKTFDTAAELLNVHAKRKAKQGIKYDIPKKEYNSFCKEFPFIETADQKTTIKEIEIDLKSKKPMDRLVCGEVGFGKTEVAIRAAFLSAYNNFQTCVLVPTTILAQQHYESFSKRFQNTAITIEKLSSDLKPNKREKVLESLSSGNVDIIIGTHSLLQDSIKFSKLGLLIIDEEHKFGVKQKEKIKTLKENINILYLSATPIPRSLNFALSELKDLSIIATAPEDRLSVRTFVHEFNENLIKESIQREVIRNGQIYYLCNDLRLIEDRKIRLEKIFPSKNIEIVHGKLKSSEIEEKMLLFQNKKIDILVCSTIIESGLDIPNANTLIVEESDMLGLSQLHQLRGRVGRGKKQAYAYFLKSSKILRRKRADRRLKTLQDTDSLSAGFLLSMKDLEARGAGEILGENQSGIMESIGVDLYIRLVNRAAKQIKEGKIQPLEMEKQTEINLNTSSYIPDNYLPDINQRLVMYSRISSVISINELKDIKIEMINRFGLFPKELKSLFFEKEISLIAFQKNIVEVSINKKEITIKHSDPSKNKSLKKGLDLEANIKKIDNYFNQN